MPDTPFDAATFKARTRDQWDKSAGGWDKHGPEIRAWLRIPTDAMLAMAGISTGHRVLDVAAGAGDQTLDIAARVGPTGSVLATDISSDILELARANAKREGYSNVAVHRADAEDLMLDEQTFDAATCRLGLMFLPDPLKGLAEIRSALKPGAGFCCIAFAGPDQNPCLRILMGTALRHAGAAPRDPFQPGGLMSLGRPGHIDALFQQAGFRNVATTKMEAPFRLPNARAYLAFIRDSAGPILQILAPLDAEAQSAAWADIERQLTQFQTNVGWSGPNTLLLTAGVR